MVKKTKTQIVEAPAPQVQAPQAPQAIQVPDPIKKTRVKKERTPEQIEADKERMAKLRAMRKTGAAKVSK